VEILIKTSCRIII